jgi:site-specific recombinase XerD
MAQQEHKGPKAEGKGRGVFERPAGSGVWWILFYDQDGRRHREKIGPKSLAVAAYRKRKTQVKEDKYFPESEKQVRLTVKAAIKGYLDTHTENKSRPSDLGYAARWNEAFGDDRLETLTKADLLPWLQQRAADSSPSTARHYLAFLRRVCRLAVENRLLTHDPTVGITMGPDKKRDRYLTYEEEERLRPEIPANRWSLVEIAYLTGMRQGEQFPLRRTQVDLKQRLIRLEESKGAKLAGEGGPEYVRLNAQAVEVLRQQLASHDSIWVWPNDAGTNHLDAHNWTQDTFKPACERAGVVDLRWHDLRHSFCSRLVNHGVELYDVMQLARHRDFKSAQRYAHLAEDRLRSAIEKVGGPPARDHKENAEQKPTLAKERIARRRQQKPV